MSPVRTSCFPISNATYIFSTHERAITTGNRTPTEPVSTVRLSRRFGSPRMPAAILAGAAARPHLGVMRIQFARPWASY